MDTDKLKSIEDYLINLEKTLSDMKCDRAYLHSQLPRVVTKIQILSTSAFITNDSQMQQKLIQLEAAARRNLDRIENLLSQNQ